MEFYDSNPIYMQLAEQVMDDLQEGRAQPGDRLPSVREKAAAIGVNPNTVMRTYTTLQQMGIIFNRRGIGYFYADDARDRVVAMRRSQMLDKEIYVFMDRLRGLGISPEEFAELYRNYLQTPQNK